MNGYQSGAGGRGGAAFGNRPRQGGGSSQTGDVKQVTAPYNFVPLSERVFLPDWAGLVSHDVPFSDGVSGEITCELTAESPIYIRNGVDVGADQDAKKLPGYTDFFRVDDKPLIPGSSIKGMLRNVIEIVSFGKMGSRVDDHRYGVRDLNNEHLYTSKITETIRREGAPNLYKPRPRAAWLGIDSQTGGWSLEPCEFARVEQQDLVDGLGGKGIELWRRQGALDKYRKWSSASLKLKVQFDLFDETEFSHKVGMLAYRKVRGNSLGKGAIPGTIVFTGQSSDRDPKSAVEGKHMEFVFHGEGGERHPLPPTRRKEFEFIHSDPSGVPNKEWGHWKRVLENKGKVPVFFLGDVSAPTSMGLALMYRLAYDNSVHDAIRHSDPNKQHLSDQPDLSDILFGYLPGESGNSSRLKGRVQLSHAEATEFPVVEEEVITILGAPKPTFYPNYICQGKVGPYKTFMDADCKIRGWKRYPARLEMPVGVTGREILPQRNDGTYNEDVATKFRPLGVGATFRFKVRVHNLRPVELGALIWGLTWGGDESLRHSLGMGKAIGYGKVKIHLAARELYRVTGESFDGDALDDFITCMRLKIGDDWDVSEQLVQLKAMANPEHKPTGIGQGSSAGDAQKEKLRHLKLGRGKDNQFVQVKKKGWSLAPHADFVPSVKAKPPVPVGLTDRFSEARTSNNKERIFEYLKGLVASDAIELGTFDFSKITVLDIGAVDEFVSAEMTSEIRVVVAKKMLEMIKKNKNWDPKKLSRYEMLRSLATKNGD